MDQLFLIQTGAGSPPVQYWIASDPEKGLVVSPKIKGLTALRGKYKYCPGLGGIRQLYKTVALYGPETISLTAATLQLDWARQRRYGKNSVLSRHNGEIHLTVAKWCEGFFCGKEIAEFVGAKPTHRFLDCWQDLALASEYFPQQEWGGSTINPQELIVRTLTGAIAASDVAARVLELIMTWERGWEFPSDKSINFYLCARN